MATSNAPAGATYRNVEHAGECTLQENANSFPDTNKSCMIPPKFVVSYPEPTDESTGEIVKTDRALSQKEERRLTGVMRNASGEEAEYKVFKVFERLAQMQNEPPLLIMRNYELRNFKANVLVAELGINFEGIHTAAEFDAVIAIKDTGLILVEVKRRFTDEQQAKAEDQLENGKLFFERIMCHLSGSTCHLPVVKVIMFPDETSASPTTKSDRDTHIVCQDLLTNFYLKWHELTRVLQALKSSSSLDGNNFKRFVHTLTGVWCMEKYQKRFYKFNNDEASSTYQLQKNDDMIKRAVLTSDVGSAKNESKIVQPLTNVELCRPQDGFPNCEGMDLIYLTPEQKNLYQNVPKAIIRAPAGAGKTLLSYLKIVDILQNHSNKNILIIAPDPHHLRMEQFVRLNGGNPTMTNEFPPTEGGGVVIITLEKFFKVYRETLQSYDVSMFHVFIDDMQSLQSLLLEGVTSYVDVAEFIERCYNEMIGNDQTFWCAVDEGQSFVIDDRSTRSITHLFNDDKILQQLTIPIYNLDKTLRNSAEISTVTQKIRELRVEDWKVSSHVLTNSTTGHRIRSETVIYHKLMKWTGHEEEDWKKHGFGFAVERVKEELKSLLEVQKHSMKLNDIAVLYDLDDLDDEFKSELEERLREMLVNTFNITPQTIKEFTMTNNNAIILDGTENVASFECACVLYLCCYNEAGRCDNYNVMTRARTKLVVVEYDYFKSPPLLTDDVILIQWEEKDGLFHKL